MKQHLHYLHALWDFSRPHTIIGSTLAVVTLYLVASHEAQGSNLSLLFTSLGAALAVNMYIVGLNQLTDIDIDHINKPHLPIPSQRLRITEALTIILCSGLLALGLAWIGGWWLLFTIGTVFIVGSVYSLPPLRLKRFPVLAMLSIVLSRGVVGNLGLWLTFCVGLHQDPYIPFHLIIFTAFIVTFMLVIALLKDAPDVAGDQAHSVRTFSVRYGPHRITQMAVCILIALYVVIMLSAIAGIRGMNGTVMVLGHAIPSYALLKTAPWQPLVKPDDIAKLYQRIWHLYYLEFGVYVIACLTHTPL
ncbi:MAG: homogentisate phytyltransferase [Myxococcales bacterium]|nr:homogentisate phytyltransferase [Myxococcales bacterium]